jgi:hypothetical protein
MLSHFTGINRLVSEAYGDRHDGRARQHMEQPVNELMKLRCAQDGPGQSCLLYQAFGGQLMPVVT